MIRKNPVYRALISVLFILACAGTLLSGAAVAFMAESDYYQFNTEYFDSLTDGRQPLLMDVPFSATSSVHYDLHWQLNNVLSTLEFRVVSESDIPAVKAEAKKDGMDVLDISPVESGSIVVLSSLSAQDCEEYAFKISTADGKELYSSGEPDGDYAATGEIACVQHDGVLLTRLCFTNGEYNMGNDMSFTVRRRTDFSREEMIAYVEANPGNFGFPELEYSADDDNGGFVIPFTSVNFYDPARLDIGEILADMAWDAYENDYYDYGYDEKTDSGYIISDEIITAEPEYTLTVAAAIAKDGVPGGTLGFEKAMYDRFYPLRVTAVWVLAASFVTALVTFILMLFAAGWKKGFDEPQRRWIDKIPFDLFTLLCIGAGALTVAIFNEATDSSEPVIAVAGILLAFAAFAFVCVIWLLSLTRRIKTRTLLKNNLVVYFIRWIVKLFSSASSMWLLAIAGVVYGVFSLAAITSYDDAFIIFWALISLLLFGGLCVFDVQLEKIFKTAKSIADGDTAAVLDGEKMFSPLRRHADSINSIGSAANEALEEKLASERMKTDLIANVSHDIKTPLTSIISYIDLLKGTDVTDPQAREYIDVLDRQSVRLKRLVQDIVDASKASSGCVNADIEPTDLRELLAQAVAEYSDRLGQSGVTPVIDHGEDADGVLADGRLLWRVFDNLLSNICKYSQPGTRAYIDAKRVGGRVTVSFRSISAEALNIPPETLMERFVRGDRSRHTDGSGLGLSIARSLVELQNGSFGIAIDGDLFRAEVTLPACELPANVEPPLAELPAPESAQSE